jgi:predicted phage terminase large subunit-like protein
MEPTKHEIYFSAVKSDLKTFLLHAFDTLEPDRTFLDNWHVDLIIHYLERAIEGKEPRLIINLPPRQLKSMLVSVVLPAFILGLDPTARIICVSYNDELAKKLSRDFKRIVESKWYRLIFPDVRPTKITESEFATDVGGSRYATSVGGTLTGRGGDFIVIDDPIKPEDTHSDSARKKTNDWFQSTLLSRLDDKARSVLILVMQRLHVNDLTAYVEGCGGFTKLALPAIATRDEIIPINEHWSYCRRDGDALHAEREDLLILEGIRDQIGPYNFAAQYQQQPETPEGNLIKHKYIKILTSVQGIKPGGRFWVSIDSALSTADTADYSAISMGYSNVDGHYVLDAERGRWGFEQLLGKALGYAKRHPEVTFIVEQAGSGISLIQYLRKERIPCITYRPKEDKVVRAALVLPIFYAGRVYLVSREGSNAWVEPYVNELVSFPNGRFDDQVDSLVQALRWAERLVNPGGGIYFM